MIETINTAEAAIAVDLPSGINSASVLVMAAVAPPTP